MIFRRAGIVRQPCRVVLQVIVKTPSNNQVVYIIKPLLFLLCIAPFGLLIGGAINDTLGVNPVETLTHETGEWALRFLLITLCVTPLRRLLKVNWLVKIRRMLGLFMSFYALLHFITYIWLDQFFDWFEIIEDIPKRPFITVGFISFVLLLPLVITSTNAMQRRLKKRWLTLHKLIYIIPLLALTHYAWAQKADYSEPIFYALVFIVLMLPRAIYDRKNSRIKKASQ